MLVVANVLTEFSETYFEKTTVDYLANPEFSWSEAILSSRHIILARH